MREAIHRILTKLLCCGGIGDFVDFAGTLHNLNSCGGGNEGTEIHGAPTLAENVGTLLLARREQIGSKLCHVFARLMKRLRRTVEQLAESLAKKKEPFKELK